MFYFLLSNSIVARCGQYYLALFFVFHERKSVYSQGSTIYAF